MKVKCDLKDLLDQVSEFIKKNPKATEFTFEAEPVKEPKLMAHALLKHGLKWNLSNFLYSSKEEIPKNYLGHICDEIIWPAIPKDGFYEVPEE